MNPSERLHAHPRFPLGFLPTPIVPADRLRRQLGGPRLLIKRDDQTGLAMGGNKVRKLEYLVGEALATGCDALITGGASQSNHCRQTAAAAAAAGIPCHLVLGGSPPEQADGNLLLDALLGARLHWAGEQRKGETIPDVADMLRRQGVVPYLIPYGGSSPTGALGFVTAALELAEQLAAMGEQVDHVVVASSSGGTQAGLMVGSILAGLDARIIGIGIDKGAADDLPFARWVEDLAARTAALLGLSPSVLDAAEVHEEFAGPGYGVVSSLERAAIHRLAAAEGILVDPVYTGRALGGLMSMIEQDLFASTDTVLFWHTGGGPALFPYRRELLVSS